MLLCPICREPLIKKEKRAVCQNGHSFDYARQGYLNLLIKQSVDHGDGKDMVEARTAFLNSGAYAFLRDAIKECVEKIHPAVLVDLGCGQGYYTSALEAKEKYGFDMSKDALKYAARNDPKTQYAVASIFHLPLADESCDMMLTCFAPFAKEEVERCLRHGGSFLFVSPGPRHLIELKNLLYQHPYLNEVKPLETSLVLKKEQMISLKKELEHKDLINLFAMTPYVHRTEQTGKKKLDGIEKMSITAEFVLRLYEKQ